MTDNGEFCGTNAVDVGESKVRRTALLPTMLALRDQLQAKYGYTSPLRVGAAGGIATPASVAAAYSMGAAYVLTGTVNQACVESGSSDIVRQMLAEASQADVVMAPAADMFEMGVQVQVLKRGTMFAMRAKNLYEIYRAYGGLDEIPEQQRGDLEKNYFREPVEQVCLGEFISPVLLVSGRSLRWARCRDLIVEFELDLLAVFEADTARLCVQDLALREPYGFCIEPPV